MVHFAGSLTLQCEATQTGEIIGVDQYCQIIYTTGSSYHVPKGP